jgi:hypothetical protein
MCSIIRSGQWLRDDEMDHAQGLLHRQYPHVGGLQTVLVFEATINIGTPVSQCVQLLLIGNNHWVCCSNLGCKPNQIQVFDSALVKADSPKLKKQLTRLVHTEENQLIIEWPEFQVYFFFTN